MAVTALPTLAYFPALGLCGGLFQTMPLCHRIAAGGGD